MADLRAGLNGRVYQLVHSDSHGARLSVDDVVVAGIDLVDGQLVGSNASVESRCVLFETGTDGELYGRPMDPIGLRRGTLCFDPAAGGARTRENRLARGAFNEAIAEATRFGMVNASFHVERAAGYFNGLLRDLGAPALPVVHVVVAAHSGSRLPGYAHGDGDHRKGRLHPLQGGHYRLSARTTGVPKPIPVRAGGEIHLGPGRFRAPYGGEASYLRNAAHNLATIYHEYGHHLCRHTADFRINAERRPGAQRNGKTGPEEGICDYVTASLLGTGHPYGSYWAARGERRDPAVGRPLCAGDESDPHAIGARWSSVFWHTRLRLLMHGLIESPRDHDRVLVRALLSIGATAAKPGDTRRRRERSAERQAPSTIASAYLAALDGDVGGRAASLAAELLESGELLGESAGATEAGAC
jgi:hypothetical protein